MKPSSPCRGEEGGLSVSNSPAPPAPAPWMGQACTKIRSPFDQTNKTTSAGLHTTENLHCSKNRPTAGLPQKLDGHYGDAIFDLIK